MTGRRPLLRHFVACAINDANMFRLWDLKPKEPVSSVGWRQAYSVGDTL